MDKIERLKELRCYWIDDRAFIDLTPDEHRYIFRPTVPVLSGTLPEGGAAVTDPCEIALDHFEGVLEVVSVDGMTEAEDIVTIN